MSARLQRRFDSMEAVAQQEFESQGIAREQIVHERAIDLRYSIQKYELPVPVARSGLKPDAIAAWRRAFDEIHEKHFGSRAEDQKVEIVNYRLTTKVIVPKPAYWSKRRRTGLTAKPRSKRGAGLISTAGTIRRCMIVKNCAREITCADRRSSSRWIRRPWFIPGKAAQIDRFGNIIIELA